jgi:hypothetical protein
MWLQDQINGSRTSLESHKLSHNGAGVSVAVADTVGCEMCPTQSSKELIMPAVSVPLPEDQFRNALKLSDKFRTSIK